MASLPRLLFLSACVLRATAGRNVSSDDVRASEEEEQHRSVFQLGHMIRCQSGCDPWRYKRYGCFCGFKGSGRPVDSIDNCCLNHDWCYSRLGCPPLLLYVLRYAWSCKRPGSAHCPVQNQYGHSTLNRCARRLCECDRTFGRCVSMSGCPHRKAVCWTNPLIALTNLVNGH